MPEVGKEKERPPGLPEKCDVTVDSAGQAPGPPANAVAPNKKPTSDLEEVIDVDWEDDASGANTDDEPQ